MQDYLKKFKMSRVLFIKIFNLYCSLSFITVLRNIKKMRGQGSAEDQELASPKKSKKPKASGGITSSGKKDLQEGT